jgi:hypothetical protein
MKERPVNEAQVRCLERLTADGSSGRLTQHGVFWRVKGGDPKEHFHKLSIRSMRSKGWLATAHNPARDVNYELVITEAGRQALAALPMIKRRF